MFIGNKTEISKVNFFVLLVNVMEDSFFIVGYGIEFIKGTKSLTFFSILLALILIPMISATFVYIKNRQSRNMRLITLSGYFALYIFTMFTAVPERPLVFVYMFPIILGYFLYFDMRIIVASCASLSIINVVKILYYIVFLKLTDSFNMANYLIQFAAVSLFSLAMILSTKLSNQFNIDKINNIESERKKQEAILQDVL